MRDIAAQKVRLMLSWLWRWLTYSAYDRQGMLRILLNRQPDPDAFRTVQASSAEVQRVLTIICEAFDIDLVQQFCLRPEDNLADIYRAMTKYRMGDDLEYERLLMALAELVGEFRPEELCHDINVTVREVIEFVSHRQREQSRG